MLLAKALALFEFATTIVTPFFLAFFAMIFFFKQSLNALRLKESAFDIIEYFMS